MNGPPVLTSFIREDLRSSPGPVLAAALTALSERADVVAAPPRRLPGRLAARGAQAGTVAPRAGAAATHGSQPQRPPGRSARRQLVSRWRRGRDRDPAPAPFVAPAPGDFHTELFEHVVAYGPTGLATPRTLLEMSMRNGAAPGHPAGTAGRRRQPRRADRAGRSSPPARHRALGRDRRRRHGTTAPGCCRRPTACWPTPATSSPTPVTLRRWRSPTWSRATGAAAPGSSVEAMGWDLAPLGRRRRCHRRTSRPRGVLRGPRPSPCPRGLDLPRMHGALALRRSLLARASGDQQARRHELDQAARAFAASWRPGRRSSSSRSTPSSPTSTRGTWDSTRWTSAAAGTRPPGGRSRTCWPGRSRWAAGAGASAWAGCCSGAPSSGTPTEAPRAPASPTWPPCR